MLKRLILRLRDERGISLIMALGITTVLTISSTTMMVYTTSSQRSSSRSSADQTALALAEAGMNNAISVLNNPSNNALQQSTLPASEGAAGSQAYDGGTAYWWGTLVGNQWTIYGKGVARNPTGPDSGDVVRRVSSSISVTSSVTQPLNNQAWNYIYVTKTAAGCDQHFSNNVVVKAPMYVDGDLCLDNNASIQKAGSPPNPEPMINLVVKGTTTLSNNAFIGTNAARINQAYLVGGCNGHNPCKWNGGGDPVWANTVGTSPPDITAPTADFDYYYSTASPGPNNPCTTSSGTPPVFENEVNNKTRNTSAGTINLTPAASYTCHTSTGTLDWDVATRVLTVSGAIFIDGNVTFSGTSQYNGMATMYVNGTVNFGNSVELCGGISGGNCDFSAWNPNTEMLIFVVNGTAGGATDYGVTLSNNAMFQGGVYASHAMLVSNNANTEGPIIASNVEMSNNFTAKPFPTINSVPVGTPGNPNVHADPQPPSNFSG